MLGYIFEIPNDLNYVQLDYKKCNRKNIEEYFHRHQKEKYKEKNIGNEPLNDLKIIFGQKNGKVS